MVSYSLLITYLTAHALEWHRVGGEVVGPADVHSLDVYPVTRVMRAPMQCMENFGEIAHHRPIDGTLDSTYQFSR